VIHSTAAAGPHCLLPHRRADPAKAEPEVRIRQARTWLRLRGLERVGGRLPVEAAVGTPTEWLRSERVRPGTANSTERLAVDSLGSRDLQLRHRGGSRSFGFPVSEPDQGRDKTGGAATATLAGVVAGLPALLAIGPVQRDDRGGAVCHRLTSRPPGGGQDCY